MAAVRRLLKVFPRIFLTTRKAHDNPVCDPCLQASEEAIRRKVPHHDTRAGVPFSSLPFKYKTKWRMTIMFALFFGSGLGAPCAMFWYIMWRRQNGA